jgi:hypothetical protein
LNRGGKFEAVPLPVEGSLRRPEWLLRTLTERQRRRVSGAELFFRRNRNVAQRCGPGIAAAGDGKGGCDR